MIALDAETAFPAAQSCQVNFNPGSRRMAATAWLIFAAGSLLLAFSVTSFAQSVRPAANASAAIKPPAVIAPAKPVVSKPVWAELTVQQQIALRPLSYGCA